MNVSLVLHIFYLEMDQYVLPDVITPFSKDGINTTSLISERLQMISFLSS